MSVQFKPRPKQDKSYDFCAETYKKYILENNEKISLVWIEQMNELDRIFAKEGEQ